jgi:TPR repeat protein
VERDTSKAKYYYELAAMGGHVRARHNLGIVEGSAGNMNRAMTHLMISAQVLEMMIL